jgi:NAD(P)-dependent dehydrogenase (short-subunit alcohol dehydrogenase family)
MRRLQGKVAVILGTENSVGRAVAETFCHEGATVVPLTIHGDDESVWAQAFDGVASSHWRVDVVVNAMHRCVRKPIVELSADDFMYTFNAIGETMWLAQKLAIMCLRKSGGGIIINVTTVLGRVAAADCAALCAAARGVLMSTKSAALECARAKDNIIVSAVLAGRIEDDPDHWPDGALLPTAPIVTPEDVAEGVVFLATDGAAYMTGVELPVDGGFLAS